MPRSAQEQRPNRIWLCATQVMLLSASVAVHAQTNAAIARGQAVAQNACAGCHAMDGGQGITIQGTAVPTFRAIAGTHRTPERLKDIATTPPHPMPAIPLSLGEIEDVVAYINSLQ